MRVHRLFSILVAILTFFVMTGNVQDAEAQDSGSDQDASECAERTLSIEKRLLTIEEAIANLNKQTPKARPEDWSSYFGQPPMRAIVAARLKHDEPIGGGVWKGRLISPDPNKVNIVDYERVVNAGAKLALVNLCDEDVTFTFDPALLVEGYVFTVPADEVRIVTVKTGVKVDKDDDKRFFSVVSDTAFGGLPGPIVLIP